MGFEFKSEQERNPTPQSTSHEEILLQNLMESYDRVKAQLEEVNEFIDENRLLQTFYAWKALREQLNTGAKVIE